MRVSHCSLLIFLAVLTVLPLHGCHSPGTIAASNDPVQVQKTRFLDPRLPFIERLIASERLAGTPEGKRALRAEAHNSETLTRKLVVGRLWGKQDREDQVVLEQMLMDPDPNIRVGAMLGLEECKVGPAVARSVAQYLGPEYIVGVRIDAARVLASFRRPEDLAVFKQALHDKSPEIREGIYRSLAYYMRPDANSLLKQGTHDPDKQVAVAARNGLAGKLGNPILWEPRSGASAKPKGLS